MSKRGGKRIIKVDALARVEGEGALYLRVKNGQIKELKFRIYEPPRFFEALLQGRSFSEAPDITARICGICPMAYIQSACMAMEQALGVQITEPLQALRRLAYCGEWIESHVLHVFLLHAPDFLGYQDSIALAKDHPQLVRDALALKKLGNAIIETLGGRAIHPVNFKVGGFYRLPDEAAVKVLEEPLKRALESARLLALAVAEFNFPEYRHDYLCVSLHHPDEYPIDRGEIISSDGLAIPVAAFEKHFDEQHVEHSNALHGVMRGHPSPYLVGPIARYNNNFDQLSTLARETAQVAGLGKRVTNPYRSILVRMIEVLYACEEALRLVQAYRHDGMAAADVTAGAGTGHGCTEAPRGICYHRYQLDQRGDILQASIIPPTAQNQPQIEQDLHGVVEGNLHLPDEELKWLCEQAIRNYDPCISCATHFLKLTIDRE